MTRNYFLLYTIMFELNKKFLPSNDNRLFPVPGRVFCHDLGVSRDVLRRQLRQLIGLSVDPSERLELLQVLVVRQHRREVDSLVGTPLRRHHDATNFFHLK